MTRHRIIFAALGGLRKLTKVIKGLNCHLRRELNSLVQQATMDSTAAILQGVEKLTHAQRVQQMIAYGKQSKNNAHVNELINTFASASQYEQALSLESCYGSRDVSIAVRTLQSPSKHLKQRAIHLIVLLGSDEELILALKSVPTYLQISTIRRMSVLRPGRKRLAAINFFLETLQGNPDDQKLFRSLFVYGSEALVQRHFPAFQHSLAHLEWSRLIKHHPNVARKGVLEWASHVEFNHTPLCSWVTTHLSSWAAHPLQVDSVLELVKLLLAKVPIESFPIQVLASKRPKQTVQIILGCKDDLSETSVSSIGVKVLRELPMDLFLPLFKRYPHIVEKWNFVDLKPDQRLAVYQEFRIGWRDDEGVLGKSVVAVLPGKERVQEARRHLKLRTFEAKPEGKVPYIAFLPWEEAMELQKEFIQDSDADVRGPALREQIAAAKWDGTHLGDALQLILYRKNDQDPVKTEMMNGLNDIPLGRWKEEHLEALAQIIRNTLDAGDTSSATIYPLLYIVTDLTESFPEWGKTQLQIITRDRSEMPRWKRPTGKVPVKDTMAVFASAFAPLLKKLLANNNGSDLWILSTGFGYQTKYWSELLDACEKTFDIHEMFRWRGVMINVLKQHRPKTWSHIVPRLISENNEASGMPVLLKQVHCRQQNLLMENYIMSANWWTKKALHTLTGGFWRWTADQQAGFASLLLADIADGDKTEKDKVRAINQLALLTHFTTTPLTELASGAKRPVLQEAALRALGRLDDDRGISTLVEALSDQRARIAIYALRSSLKSMSKPETLSLLQGIPQTKITVAKETLRLIGDLETEPALQHLLSISRKEDLHTDVRVALLRALWPFLYASRPEAWDVFESAAQSDVVVIAKASVNFPEYALVETLDQPKLLNLLLLLLRHPSAPVRLHALEKCAALQLDDEFDILTTTLLARLRSPIRAEQKQTAHAIFAMHLTNVPFMQTLYRHLVAPGQQLLLKLVHDDVLLSKLSPDDWAKHYRPAVLAILPILATDRLSVTRRIHTLFAALSWAEIRPLLEALATEMHPGAVGAACAFLEAPRAAQSRWAAASAGKGRWRREGDSDASSRAERAWARWSDERGRRLGVALLVGNVAGKGWEGDALLRLQAYRVDESPWVAEAAWAVDTGEGGKEGEEGKGEDKDVVME